MQMRYMDGQTRRGRMMQQSKLQHRARCMWLPESHDGFLVDVKGKHGCVKFAGGHPNRAAAITTAAIKWQR